MQCARTVIDHRTRLNVKHYKEEINIQIIFEKLLALKREYARLEIPTELLLLTQLNRQCKIVVMVFHSMMVEMVTAVNSMILTANTNKIGILTFWPSR